MTTLRTLVVDDEHLARRGLIMRLANIEGVEVVAECANGLQALEVIAEHQPDLLFLDIQMPEMSGFDLVSKLQGDTLPMVVFVTAFNEYAVDAFKVNAIDYVLKPLEEERVRRAVERAQLKQAQTEAVDEKARLLELVMALEGREAQEMLSDATAVNSPEPTPKLLIRDGAEVRFIPMADIEWVEAAGDYMCVHAAGDTHIMRTTLKQLEEQLAGGNFARIHRSTIVNTDRIAAAHSLPSGEYRLELEGGEQLKVSRGHRDVIRGLFAHQA